MILVFDMLGGAAIGMVVSLLYPAPTGVNQTLLTACFTVIYVGLRRRAC